MKEELIESKSESQPVNKLTYQQEKEAGLRRSNGALNLKRLKPKHLRIIECHIGGLKNKEIAELTGHTPSWISLVLSDPLSQQLLEAHTQEQRSRLVGMYERSLDAVEDALDATHKSSGEPAHATRLKAADMVMKLRGEYNENEDAEETAEDVIERMLQVLPTQVNVQINNQLEAPVPARVIEHGDD